VIRGEFPLPVDLLELKVVIVEVREPSVQARNRPLALPVVLICITSDRELPGFNRLSDHIPHETEPTSWLKYSANLSDRGLGLEPVPGVSNQDSFQRPVLRWNVLGV